MRCKACDIELEEGEIIWYPELHRHEELCFSCRRLALYDVSEDTDVLDVLLTNIRLLNEGE